MHPVPTIHDIFNRIPELIVCHDEGLILFGVVCIDHQIVRDKVLQGVCSFVNV